MSSWRVLVVCEQNRVRSPLAAGLLAAYCSVRGAEAIEVASAGTRVQAGEPPPAAALEVARTMGLDLDRHRSRRVTADQVASSDLVLTMTERQRDEVQRLSPAATMRTFTLVELVRLLRAGPGAGTGPTDRVREAHSMRPRVSRPSLPEDVEDPVGHSDKTYASSGEKLARLVEALADQLIGDGDSPATATARADDAALGRPRSSSAPRPSQ